MKKTLFNIDESEKQRILEMHQSATMKQYLGEQVATGGTTVQKTKMSPMSTDKIMLSNGSYINLYQTWNQKGTEPKTTFTVRGDYGIDSKTKQKSTNLVTVSMSNNDIAGFNVRFTYDCTSKQGFNKTVQSPNDGSMKDAKYTLTTGNNITNNINSEQYPNLVQSHIKQIIDKTGISTKDSPVSDVITYYCPTT